MTADGHGAICRDVATILGAGPRVAAAALLDASSLLERARGAPKALRRKARYLALWCGAPRATQALDRARDVCAAAAARHDRDRESDERDPDAVLPSLVDLALDDGPPRPPRPPPVRAVVASHAVTDFDEPD